MISIEKFYKCFKLNFTDNDIIKRSGQEYLSLDSEGLFFIRNFCVKEPHQDIDSYYQEEEIKLVNKNIYENLEELDGFSSYKKYSFNSSAYVINNCSPEHSKFLNIENCLFVGINDGLINYSDKMNLYMNNNPYEAIINFLPKNRVFPDGLFSYRTNPKFLGMYKGIRYGFNSPNNIKKQETLSMHNYSIVLEDHRNIILSLLNLMFILKIGKIVFLDLFNYLKEEKPGTVYIKNGIYMYPQQIIETSIISAGIFWLKKYGIDVYICNGNYDFIQNLITIDSEKVINGDF